MLGTYASNALTKVNSGQMMHHEEETTTGSCRYCKSVKSMRAESTEWRARETSANKDVWPSEKRLTTGSAIELNGHTVSSVT